MEGLTLKQARELFIHDYLLQLIFLHHGCIVKIAEVAGIERNHVARLIIKHELSKYLIMARTRRLFNDDLRYKYFPASNCKPG